MSWNRLTGPRLCVVALLVGPLAHEAGAQEPAPTAQISEEIRTLDTYPFSEPNPVPILVRDPRLYPYHSFEGYSVTSEPQEWKVVKLENEWIEVFVLPEVGGKVWGAVVKETGHEFIYRNEVMKFRNISLRGPWTSGGIEFNFGVIGHTPSTATPVDYTLVENPDGSVSCWVGAMDLPSRTHWRVEVRLPADRAYFETNVLWYNPTPLEQPYYNWMTAAAFAQEDLEMSMPGDAYLRHSGEAEAWPVDDQGRYLSLYDANRFEGHKSYHVVGELNDFFGGYYHDEDYGFGHWARYEDMPGQKLWLWALSREGGVWEDLLTDTDGQYVEFQAGRLFVQYSPGSHVNPITQAGFDPLSASRWTETWFPLEGIGGLSDASRDGALHAVEEGGFLQIGVHAFRTIQDTLKVWSGGELVATASVNLDPLKPLTASFDVLSDEPFRVQLAGLDLDHTSDPVARRLNRPFDTDPGAFPDIPEVDRMVFQARELMKGREYARARDLFELALQAEPWNRDALLGSAELLYRSASYGVALDRVNRALQLDAYDAKANFIAGAIYRAFGRPADARDAFGWAARSTGYRAASYVALAQIMIVEEDYDEATRYARLATDFDRYSVSAWQALALIGRKENDGALAGEALDELVALDPLHHFVRAETYLQALQQAANPTKDPASAGGAAGPAGRPQVSAAEAGTKLAQSLGGEFPDQTLLELAIGYTNLGQREDALKLLTLFRGDEPRPLVHRAWIAWLWDDPSLLEQTGDPAFEFPYRRETLPVLAWAESNSREWAWAYLHALNLWAMDREDEAAGALNALGRAPDFGPVHAARAHLLSEVRGEDPGPDLRHAVDLAPNSRILHVRLIRHYQEQSDWEGALLALEKARSRFPNDFNLDLLQAKTLLNLGRALEAASILESTHVLPSENARESHHLYEQAHVMAALDALDRGATAAAKEHLLAALEWPESLGQGRPYE
ncbi:MAG: DUF5107 domain-containing protein, partial [Gemmatimonadetes bacterium]|nr:DUF5107 domain-containing protein [Gemmatimonadota bacterium]